MKKAKYRISNWRDDNEALVNRGSLTFWLAEEAMDSWHKTQRCGCRGTPPRGYSDVAIQCALTLGVVFRLPLWATEGLVRSVIEVLELALLFPDYMTLECQAKLGAPCRVQVPVRLSLS